MYKRQGLLEALMVWLRRWFVLGPSTSVEYDMRTSFYERLQRLPVAFHDRWQSGQLLSRMMQDISMLRRWLAFGLVLLVVNMLTILVGMVLLFRWHWALGLTFLLVCAPLWYAGYRFEKTYGTLARQAETLRETELSKARAVGWIWFWLVLLPDLAFALCLGVGIVLAQTGQLQVCLLYTSPSPRD